VDDVRQLGSREVYRSPWMSVREDDVVFAGGARGIYSVVDKPDFVVVLACENDGFWLVQQYRYAVGSRQWEFPQGGWPPGHDGAAEDLAAAELREETGIRAGTLVHLGRLFAAYGYSSQAFDVYLATALAAGQATPEETEADIIHEWRSDADVRTMIRSGELADAHSLAALQLYDLNRSRF
jgi:8-oxo-dGTP pyrophosphatase MutT (NUDIX family)